MVSACPSAWIPLAVPLSFILWFWCEVNTENVCGEQENLFRTAPLTKCNNYICQFVQILISSLTKSQNIESDAMGWTLRSDQLERNFTLCAEFVDICPSAQYPVSRHSWDKKVPRDDWWQFQPTQYLVTFEIKSSWRRLVTIPTQPTQYFVTLENWEKKFQETISDNSNPPSILPYLR